MKNDIIVPKVENIWIAAIQKSVPEAAADDPKGWYIYVYNANDFALSNVLVVSKGYGEKESETKQTSVLRHLIEVLEPKTYALIEPIDPSLFALFNQYWISYYKTGGQEIYDKKFVFLPGSIAEAHLSYIAPLDCYGVLHK